MLEILRDVRTRNPSVESSVFEEKSVDNVTMRRMSSLGSPGTVRRLNAHVSKSTLAHDADTYRVHFRSIKTSPMLSWAEISHLERGLDKIRGLDWSSSTEAS